MGVSMKTFFTLILLFLFSIPIYSQIRDSTFIHSGNGLATKDNQIITFFQSLDSREPVILMHFDGHNWKKLTQDTIPTIDPSTSRCVFSRFSNHIIVAGKHYLWEYDGKNWITHSINDTLNGRREFREIIALSDSSYIITAYSEFVKSTFGIGKYLDKAYTELLHFKNGKFTTLKSRWTSGAATFSTLKLAPNDNYSMYTSIEDTSSSPSTKLVTYDLNGIVVRKDSTPDLTSFGYKMEFVKYEDYLFDSKGSLWFLTSNPQSFQFVGLVEVNQIGVVKLYNQNIGITPNTTRNLSFDIDESDNIWFSYTYRVKTLDDGKKVVCPSIYKLQKNRVDLEEYKFEDVLSNSVWFNGGDTTQQFEGYGRFRNITYQDATNSILLLSDIAVLHFFLGKETSVKEQLYRSIQLYPNPVQTDNTLTIESSLLENLENTLKLVICDLSGDRIREEVIEKTIGTQFTINTKGLIRGTYIVYFFNNNQLILKSLFIKE
jgi:hypothetical protein